MGTDGNRLDRADILVGAGRNLVGGEEGKSLASFSAAAPVIGRMSMPEPVEASSEIAAAGNPPVKKKASTEPSFIFSAAWLGLRYSGA